MISLDPRLLGTTDLTISHDCTRTRYPYLPCYLMHYLVAHNHSSDPLYHKVSPRRCVSIFPHSLHAFPA